jgi:hypothetical protein
MIRGQGRAADEAAPDHRLRFGLKLSTASYGESSILKRSKLFRFRSLTLQRAAGNALAGGFKEISREFLRT